MCGTSFILAMFHEEQSLWNPKKTGCLLIDDRDRELLLPYFLFTGSKVETPATAVVRTARTTPPATTLKSKFFKDGLMPGCAASASSGTTAAANRANPVRLVTSCSFCETLHTEASYNWLHQKCEQRKFYSSNKASPNFQPHITPIQLQQKRQCM